MYNTILVEKFGLKDLYGRKSNLTRSREAEGTYVRGRKVALLGGEIYGWSDREVTALVLVKDAGEDGGGVEIWSAIGLDLREGRMRVRTGLKLGGVEGHTGTVRADLKED